jgi:hypothetical protein
VKQLSSFKLTIDFELLEEQKRLIDSYLVNSTKKDQELLLGLSMLLDAISRQKPVLGREITLEVVRVGQPVSAVDLG